MHVLLAYLGEQSLWLTASSRVQSWGRAAPSTLLSCT